MKFMEFNHKDIYVRVHCSLLVTKYDSDQKNHYLIYTNVIDIDSRVQAVFAQFHHAKKAEDVNFRIYHAPRIGEKPGEHSALYVKPYGKYKHLSQREDETLVTGIVASERVLSRQDQGYCIFAWDGNIHEKLFWAIDAYYETPLLEEWIPYLYQRLFQDGYLIPLDVRDYTGDYSKLAAFELLAGEDILDEYVSYGLRTGAIRLVDDTKEGAAS
ncbi:Uncharacterised protein [Actinobacillus pleuropneumoniae]|jgi:hypothetical protein|uniref:hypothetical protein n=1 Tax=Paenibacillus lautus TaxID=1401 RepID=UPI0010DACACD|nr:hypothetical protein [Paenibacillus lautus]MBX4152488.1 hypothetical protein [Paenibacillus lautus]VTR32039.1 Uncharacterised protein [Actinobacillus pleuropneumoniae]